MSAGFVFCNLFVFVFSGLSLVYSHVNSIWLCLGVDLSVVFFVLAQARALAGEFVAVEQVSEPAQTSLHQNKLSRVTSFIAVTPTCEKVHKC